MTKTEPLPTTTSSTSRDFELFPTRVFSRPDVSPFDELEWTKRTVLISDDSGKTVFVQEDVEAPKSWSDMAVKVVASKYFYGQQGTPQREGSVRALIHRVVKTISAWGLKDGLFASEEEAQIFHDELCWLCVNQHAAFNSPVWFNVGLWQEYRVGSNSIGNWAVDRNAHPVDAARTATQFERPQGSACFINRVDDTMESIMALATTEAMLFKYGSGTGSDLSPIRSTRETMTGGGRPSGPLSFLRIYDQVGNVVKSGGRTRRAAKMNTLFDDHGDIEEFISAKMLEEKKAWALIDAGYDGSFNGEVYRNTISFQNENLSVRATDAFMKAATGDGEWWTKSRKTGANLEKKDARKLLQMIAEGTWICGDPGMQFHDTINRWHTCAGTEPQYSTNPCSEYLFLNNTACNLASLNLVKFFEGQRFNSKRFEAAVCVMITAQEILVDNCSYPTASIAINSHRFRTLGLGYANLGALLMQMGVPYASDEGRAVAASITALLTGRAYAQSAEIARSVGPFLGYRDARADHIPKPLKPDNAESMQHVIEMHERAVDNIEVFETNADIVASAKFTWSSAKRLGQEHGYRNAQVTVLAPTGTISFMMDCDTTGIEPDIALVKYKVLAGGGMLKIINQSVPAALRRLGYSDNEVNCILKHVDTFDTIEDQPTAKSGLRAEHHPVFDCAFKAKLGRRSIHYRDHLKMMAAAQPFVSGAISKTVNMPTESTVEEIRDSYVEAWKLGLKCVAVYRDGSKRSQPLNTSKDKLSGESDIMSMRLELEEKKRELVELWERVDEIGAPVRHRLPETRQALTHKFDIAGHEGYFTVGLFEDGSPGELFITMSKEGSTVSGLMDVVGTLTSMALQYGVPLDALVKKFSFVRFEPAGFTKNPRVHQANSVIDYVFRWMGAQFCLSDTVEVKQDVVAVPRQPTLTVTVGDVVAQSLNGSLSHLQKDAPPCPNCGTITVRNGACYKCVNCGESLGCS